MLLRVCDDLAEISRPAGKSFRSVICLDASSIHEGANHHILAKVESMIAIIDYGMGNLRSVQKGFEKVGLEAVVTADPRVVLEAERIVLPGVGAFRDCMRNLEQGGFVEPILRVIREGRPFLGICVGMQLLLTDSVEFGLYQGLNVIPGHVLRFPEGMREGGEELKVPHMGWNQLAIRQPAPIFT